MDTLHDDPADLTTATHWADRASRLACQANEWESYTTDALAFFERLQERLYGRLPTTSVPLLLKSPQPQGPAGSRVFGTARELKR